MLKDAYYFSHDANSQDDPKCMTLIDQLGMEGYGIFWALIEKLRAEKEYILPITVAGSFAKRWGTSKEKVLAVICNYQLFILVEDKFFYSQRLRESMLKKSELGRKSVSFRWQTDTNVIRSNTDVIRTDTNDIRTDTNKGKERKGKYIKEESIKEEISEEQKKEWEKFKKWADKNTPKLFQLKWPLQPKQLFSLKNQFSAAALLDVMQAMENTKPLLKKYDSAYLTIKSWAKRREPEVNGHELKPEEIGGKRLKQL